MYGRQILEALRFLHSKGLPHGHVHAGNVIVQDGVAKLMDVENIILGLPSFYRPFFMQHGKINNFEGIDVYSFGHLMFEMSMGFPLQESLARQISDCPDSLSEFEKFTNTECKLMIFFSKIAENLLDSILTRDAFKQAMPTLDQLCAHHFFTEYARNFNESHTLAIHNIKPHLKFSTNAKEQIKIAILKTESRLRDEQKSVKNQKRLVRVQELMTSEEGKKKEKQRVVSVNMTDLEKGFSNSLV
jgi:PX domain-containing protein kinase-like protein